MKTTYYSSTFVFLCFCAFFVHSSFSDFPSPEDSGCVLSFDHNRYPPSGNCIGKQRKELYYWKSIHSTLCCENALTFFSKALALRARNSKQDDNIFVPEEQWKNCNGSFHRQHSVSISYCGLDNLFHDESRQCSMSTLSGIRRRRDFQDAVNNCSRFNTSFDDTCGNCISAVVAARDFLLSELGGNGDDDERAICGMAIVVSIAAANFDDPSSVDDLFSCLRSLDKFDVGYVRIKYSVAKAIVAVCIIVVTLILVLALVKFVRMGYKKNHKRKPLKPSKEITNTRSGLYRFSKAEIENAIIAGGRKNLGRGSAGQVYKGVLPSGQVVAIKHIHKSSTTDSFNREVEGLSRIRHPNLVCLFGCCIEGGEHYLVYEFCSAGNLAHHLLKKDSGLTWEIRVKILRDCALALRYLHHYIDGCIVHRDIKLTNILLTEDMEPKLSDFGLAKMLGMEESKVFTDVRGTIGYMDPEYMSNAKLTCASDIYSFGIVALQLLSGQKVFELDLDARDQLTRKAKDVSMGKRPLTDFEDPRLAGNIIRPDFESLLQIAVLCVAKSSKGRPTIDVVFDEIEKAWKNTMAEMIAKKEMMALSMATPSRSLEVIPV